MFYFVILRFSGLSENIKEIKPSPDKFQLFQADSFVEQPELFGGYENIDNNRFFDVGINAYCLSTDSYGYKLIFRFFSYLIISVKTLIICLITKLLRIHLSLNSVAFDLYFEGVATGTNPSTHNYAINMYTDIGISIS